MGPLIYCARIRRGKILFSVKKDMIATRSVLTSEDSEAADKPEWEHGRDRAYPRRAVALQMHGGGQVPHALTLSALSLSPRTYTFPATPISHTSDTIHGQVTHVTLPTRTDLEDSEVLVTDIHQTYEDPSSKPSPPLVSDVTLLNESVAEGQMKAVKTKATIGLLATLISYVSLNSLYRTVHPEKFIWQDEDREEATWIATSDSWVDRKACRWLGVCGAAHIHFVARRFGTHVHSNHEEQVDTAGLPRDWQNAWADGADRPEDWTDDERVLREIPEYVIEYSPLVHLFSGEQFWPCDIAEHLAHIKPYLNYTPLGSKWDHQNLHNLDELNQWEHGRHVFLTSNDDVEQLPEWLEGEKNIPVPPTRPDDPLYEPHTPGRTYTEGLKQSFQEVKEWFHVDSDAAEQVPHDQLKREIRLHDSQPGLRGGRSDAPAVLVVVNKGHGIVDAFWFFFYSFNLGNVVFNVRFGNHVGDWEHSAIRFHHGQPKAVFFSEHNFGSAYSYDAVEKIGKRPVIYSATGTHAMYATPGLHPYILPWGILHDETDRGPLWDPVLNSHTFTYDYKNNTLRSSNRTPKAPTGWFDYAGHWGDKYYPLGDKRQYRFAGQYHYVNGPLGPKFKDLGRKKICGGPDSAPCVIKNWLGSGSLRVQRYHGPGEGDEQSDEDIVKFFGEGEGSKR